MCYVSYGTCLRSLSSSGLVQEGDPVRAGRCFRPSVGRCTGPSQVGVRPLPPGPPENCLRTCVTCRAVRDTDR